MSELTINITDTEKGGVKVVALTGEMDESTIENMKAQIDPILDDNGTKTLIFDLKNLSFMNSKGIGYLVAVHTHLAKNEKQIILANANDPVMDVISLVGLTSIIKYFGTLEEAISSVG